MYSYAFDKKTGKIRKELKYIAFSSGAVLGIYIMTKMKAFKVMEEYMIDITGISNLGFLDFSFVEKLPFISSIVKTETKTEKSSLSTGYL